MISTPKHSEEVAKTSDDVIFDMKLEIVIIPVTDVDRAKRFYSDLGWRLDIDFNS